MTIAKQLSKLLFIVQELEAALCIVRTLPDDHHQRVLARRVAVRTKDFIVHARRLRKPVHAVGGDTRDFHARKEAYAAAFEEYLPVVRDRMGAHLQDVDMLDRLQLWCDIEVVKLEYFVQGAREIYDCLSPLGLPDYQPYRPFPELGDDDFSTLLRTLQSGAVADRSVRMMLDIVGGTRPDSVVIMNESAGHLRSKQIVSLIEWIDLEQWLCGLFAQWENPARIVKSQVLTDIVSMADCLITRPLAGTPQEMLGLDDVLLREGSNAAEITQFMSSATKTDGRSSKHFEGRAQAKRGRGRIVG